MLQGSEVYSRFKRERTSIDRQASSLKGLINDRETIYTNQFRRLEKLWEALATILIEGSKSIPHSVVVDLSERVEKLSNMRSEAEDLDRQVKSLEDKRKVVSGNLDLLKGRYEKDYVEIDDKFQSDDRCLLIEDELAELSELNEVLSNKLKRKIKEFERHREDYEEDVLFMYLRKIGYGTSEYSTWFSLFKRMDDWLADLIDYRTSNDKFERLLTAPKWVSDRLKTINDKTDRVTSDYELLRSEYFSRLSPQENAIDGKEEELDQIDQLIDNKINDIAAIDKTLDNASQFEDHLFSKIVDDYSEILKSSDNHELFRIISETETLKDDEIFDEITNILEYKSELRREIEGLVLSFNQYNSASREIRRIEDRIRVNGWSRTGHRFSGLDVHHLINGIKNEGMGAAKTLNLLSISHTPPPRRRTSIDIPQSTFSTSSSFGGSSTFTTTNSF